MLSAVPSAEGRQEVEAPFTEKIHGIATGFELAKTSQIGKMNLAVLSAHFKALQTPGKSEEKAFVRRPKGGVMPLPDFPALLLSFISAAGISLLTFFLPAQKESKRDFLEFFIFKVLL